MAYELIETVTLTSAASSIEFTSIPQDGVDLLLVHALRTADNIVQSLVRFQFNSDTGANYSFIRLIGTGSTATSSTGTSQSGALSYAAGADATANTFGNGSLLISNYTSSVAKSLSVDVVTENNATAATQAIIANAYSGTAAITSLKIIENGGANFASGSTASLYKVS